MPNPSENIWRPPRGFGKTFSNDTTQGVHDLYQVAMVYVLYRATLWCRYRIPTVAVNGIPVQLEEEVLNDALRRAQGFVSISVSPLKRNCNKNNHHWIGPPSIVTGEWSSYMYEVELAQWHPGFVPFLRFRKNTSDCYNILYVPVSISFFFLSLFHYYFEWTRWFAMMFVFLWISLFIFRFTFCSVFRIYFRNIVQLFWTLKIKLILFQMYQLSNKLLDKKAITNYQIEKVSAKLKYTTTQFKYTTN